MRKYHRFSPNTERNLGRRFDDDLPVLEKAFTEADDDASLREALFLFGNALHDWHLRYSAEREAGRGTRFRLGFDVEPRRDGDSWSFVVVRASEAAKSEGVRVDDVVGAADGVDGSALTTAHSLWSNANQWRGIAEGVAARLTERDSNSSKTRPADRETWVLNHGDGTKSTAVLSWAAAPWPGEEEADAATYSPPNYAPIHCSVDLPDRAYPAQYRLTAHGRFYCLYTASKPPYDAYPIVRHFSFLYSSVLQVTVAPRYMLPEVGWDVTSDFISLQAGLARVRNIQGVLLDLRDNIGGNEPEWFLDWYAPSPYQDVFTSLRTQADMDDPAFRARVLNLGSDFYEWYRHAAAGVALGTDIRRPFLCTTERCEGNNRWVPSHQVTNARIALIIGPQCGSSCAHFVHIFDENDFGPLIGTPTASAYTDLRLAYPVKLKTGRELGSIGLGLSVETSGKTGDLIEGAETHVDYPVEQSVAGKNIDDVLVKTAILALHARKAGPR